MLFFRKSQWVLGHLKQLFAQWRIAHPHRNRINPATLPSAGKHLQFTQKSEDLQSLFLSQLQAGIQNTKWLTPMTTEFVPTTHLLLSSWDIPCCLWPRGPSPLSRPAAWPPWCTRLGPGSSCTGSECIHWTLQLLCICTHIIKGQMCPIGLYTMHLPRSFTIRAAPRSPLQGELSRYGGYLKKFFQHDASHCPLAIMSVDWLFV